ncbi:MAG TPA: hypothetical protein VF052_06275 [Solirubrobacterales bacterium]
MSAVIDRVRTDRRVAIGLVVAALFLVAWIAWAVYVWNENGSDAGVGVLVSWPAVLAALALVASPFVAVVWFLRNREEGATAADPADEAAEAEDEEEDEDSDDEGSEGDGAEDGSEDDDPDEDGEKEAVESDDEHEAGEAETEEKPPAEAKAKPKKS